MAADGAEGVEALDEAASTTTAAADFAAQFGTGKNAAVFWSGTSDGAGGADFAANVATAQGGTTLEQLVAAKGIDLPLYDPSSPASVEAWNQASQAFAQGAQGDVTAVIGENMRPGNVWQATELPTLLQNENVTSITQINPATGARTVIFVR